MLGLTSSAAAQAQTAQPDASARTPEQKVQVPKMKFGPAEVSRLVVGCNPFYGFAHYNSILGTVMREYYTQQRVCI